jgi:tRNA(fMet)-specific endonuclease VapC
MNPPYLVDSDCAISYLGGIQKVVKKLEEYRQNGGLAISIITLAEIYEGVYGSRDPLKSQQVLNDFLSDVAVIGLDEDISKIFAQERARLRKAGNMIGDFDMMIGATALCYNMTLITNNVRHFSRIPGLTMESIRGK